MKIKTSTKIAIVGASFLFVLLLVANIVLPLFFDLINAVVCGTFSTATDAEIAECMEDGDVLADKIESEGIVLVRNEDNVLPLAKSVKKVNVFGWASTSWIYGGSGSGRCVNFEKGLLESLSDYGVEYNTNLSDFYKDFLGERPFYNNSVGSLNSHNDEFSRLYEPELSAYGNSLLDGAKSFSDTAIVVLSRVSGESADCPKTQYKQNKKGGEIVTDTTRTYLEISTEEEALLDYVSDNFDKTIVLVNSTNALELGFLETYDIDSCMIVGCTGAKAASGIIKVLYGDVNPSGKTVDTYAYDFSTAAAYANAGEEGEGAYTNSEGHYPYGQHSANSGRADENYEYVYYVDYVEGIYIGYKWYETADVEGFWASKGGYDKVVQYPFGYGLSYTNFTWALEGTPVLNENKIELKVKVTNVGSVAGRDVVELYYTAPYTKGGIEKSAVELCDFAKTGLLAPNASEVVTLSLTPYDMASYDAFDKNGNGFKGYELEAGTYGLKVMKNAHEQVLDTVDYVVSTGIQYATDPVTGKAVGNKFTGEDAIDGIAIDGSDSQGNINYMTRADFVSTFPAVKAANRAMAQNVIDVNLYTAEMANAAINPNDKPITTGAKNGMVVYEDGKGATELGLALGANYDDERWEKVLDQLTKDEMIGMVCHLYLSPNMPIPSIGKYKVYESDGPTQIGSFNAARHGTGYANPNVTAQTWDKSIARAFGLQVALEAANIGMDGWYAPGVNIHRTPFGGRNYEYYSEDEFMSGVYCNLVAKASRERGIYNYVKHFVAYDQDTNRDSMYTWLDEQTLREIYLKPFEIAVKGGLTGIMTAYNRLGAVWSGGSTALIKGVLRGEWDFHGAVLTDYSDHPIYTNSDMCIRAGGDQVLIGFGGDVSFKFETESNTFDQAIRSAAKNSIYIWLNAFYCNSISGLPARNLRVASGGWLQPVLIIVDILAFAALLFWGFRIYLKIKKSK